MFMVSRLEFFLFFISLLNILFRKVVPLRSEKLEQDFSPVFYINVLLSS